MLGFELRKQRQQQFWRAKQECSKKKQKTQKHKNTKNFLFCKSYFRENLEKKVYNKKIKLSLYRKKKQFKQSI